jgi:hypothetical protein
VVVTTPFPTAVAMLVVTVMMVITIALVAAMVITALPAVNVIELAPRKSLVSLQRGMPVPLAKRLVAFQPTWHVFGSSLIESMV